MYKQMLHFGILHFFSLFEHTFVCNTLQQDVRFVSEAYIFHKESRKLHYMAITKKDVAINPDQFFTVKPLLTMQHVFNCILICLTNKKRMPKGIKAVLKKQNHFHTHIYPARAKIEPAFRSQGSGLLTSTAGSKKFRQIKTPHKFKFLNSL